MMPWEVLVILMYEGAWLKMRLLIFFLMTVIYGLNKYCKQFFLAHSFLSHCFNKNDTLFYSPIELNT